MLPTPGGATDRLAEIFVHGVVATLMVEGLVHWVPVVNPAVRVAHRITALAAPIVLALIFELWLPFRRDTWFQDASLFVSGRWDLLRLAGIGLRTFALGVAAPLGVVLFARDAWDGVHDAREARRRETGPHAAVPGPLRAMTADLARELAIPPPAIDVLVSPDHTLHCRGIRRPRILISTGTLDALSPEQLRSAVAHELVHLAHGDLQRGWVLFGLRALQCFNPFAQAVGRRAIEEIEWRADDAAAALTGTPIAPARALVRGARHRGDQFLGLSGQGRLHALEERCRRLLGDAPPAARPAASVVILWVVLTALLVFVQ